MRPALVALLSNYGLQPTRAWCVARLGCEIYRVSARSLDGSSRDLSLRIYPPSDDGAACLETEITWLATAAAEGLHVPRPLADGSGRVIQSWRPHPAAAPRRAVVLTWLKGRMHDRALTPARLRRVGVLTARLHCTAGRLAAEGRINSARLACTSDLARWADRTLDATTMLGARLRAIAWRAARRLVDEMASLPTDRISYGLVHGDLHQWNIVFEREAAGAIDFSDCGWGHVALDLASTLQYLRHPLANNHDHRPQVARLQAMLLEGYASVRVLPQDIEMHIDLYIVARMFMTLDWIIEDWPRPDHRGWGPGFLQGVEDVFGDFLAR